MKVIHSWLKEYVGDVLPLPEKVADLLTFHAFEIDGIEKKGSETILDVSILPNRSSDCLSHRGIARELASILNVSLKVDPLTKEYRESVGKKITVTIEDETLCNRFTAAVITGVKVKESPTWLKERLEVLGQRSINNVVDATNYVMFAIGQPTHAFDFDKLTKDSDGRANITIRNGKEGESLTLLTGEEIISNPQTLHLVDGNNGALLDLAGIKGGSAAELTSKTTSIVVTSGNFNYQSVRKTSQRLKVLTDASQRFQNQPSAELASYGLHQTVSLILELAGGESDGFIDEYPVKKTPTKTLVRTAMVNSLLGITIEKATIGAYLERVVAELEEVTEGYVATAPFERTDLEIEADYIEEVGRLHGLESIKSVLVESVPLKEINQRQVYSETLRQQLLTNGFSEVITSSFQKKGTLQLQNALASDKSYLRENLAKNITATLDKNYSHLDLLGISEVRVFEIGTVFSKTASSVTEHVSVAIGVRTKGNGYVPKDDILLHEILESLSGIFQDKTIWSIDKGVAECNLSEFLLTAPQIDSYAPFIKLPPKTYQPVSTFPAISRDIALWVPENVTNEVVHEVLQQHAGELCVRIDMFDTFTKEGRTSYAFRLVFVSFERTLTDAEINTTMETIYRVVAEKGWEVR